MTCQHPRITQANLCLTCGATVEEEAVRESPLVRNTDPVESKAAARKVRVAADRMRVLGAFDLYEELTYREAGNIAAEREQEPSQARLESLRRRGSDLKDKGWIEHVRTEDGQGVFTITAEGEKQL